MVVNDGINDSLALKAGVVGVAMGAGGADIALASSDIVLIGSDFAALGHMRAVEPRMPSHPAGQCGYPVWAGPWPSIAAAAFLQTNVGR